jgi:hypothetical protein
MSANDKEQILSETDNLFVWRSLEEEGFVYHLELGSITLHLYPEEWDELVVLVSDADSK